MPNFATWFVIEAIDPFGSFLMQEAEHSRKILGSFIR